MIKEFLNTDGVSSFLGKFAAKISKNPNVWTVIAFLSGFIALYLIIIGYIYEGAIAFAIAGLLDAVDGGVARLVGKTSPLGAYVDGTLDRITDILIIASFLFLSLPDLLIPTRDWTFILVALAPIPSFIVAYANHRKAVPDPTEKVVWRILHRTEMYFLFLIILFLAPNHPAYATYTLVGTTILTAITTVHTFLLGVLKAKEFERIGDAALLRKA